MLSEFVNSCARFEYESLPVTTKPARFKDFRRSPGFHPVAQRIAAVCQRILGVCSCVESGFTSLDSWALLNEYEKGNLDLNDQVLVHLCGSKGLTLVTDDADFRGQDVTVLTANRKLLGNR